MENKIKIIVFFVFFLLLSLNHKPTYSQIYQDPNVVDVDSVVLSEIADSSYILKNKRVYRMKNGKQKFKAYLKIYEYAIDSTEVFKYLDTLFANKGDTLIIKRSREYTSSIYGLYYQNTIYKAVFKSGPKVKIFEPKVIGDVQLHWWFAWTLPLIVFLFTFAILVLVFRIKDRKLEGNVFDLFFIASFIAMLWILTGSQLFLLDYLDVPSNVAEILISHPFVYWLISIIILWISYKLFLKKLLKKFFGNKQGAS